MRQVPRAALLVLLTLAGCNEMNEQPRYDSYEKSELFQDGKSLQAAPSGTVPRDARQREKTLTQRPPMSAALLARGKERYEIYCTPCHDAAGYGNGTVPARGFPQPPSFHTRDMRQASPSHFVDVITNGHGVMYSYADRVSPSDRWAIAAYIIALQLSQNAPQSVLTPDERHKLSAGGS